MCKKQGADHRVTPPCLPSFLIVNAEPCRYETTAPMSFKSKNCRPCRQIYCFGGTRTTFFVGTGTHILVDEMPGMRHKQGVCRHTSTTVQLVLARCGSCAYRAVPQARQRNYGFGLSHALSCWRRHLDDHCARSVVSFGEKLAWVYHLKASATSSGSSGKRTTGVDLLANVHHCARTLGLASFYAIACSQRRALQRNTVKGLLPFQLDRSAQSQGLAQRE